MLATRAAHPQMSYEQGGGRVPCDQLRGRLERAATRAARGVYRRCAPMYITRAVGQALAVRRAGLAVPGMLR